MATTFVDYTGDGNATKAFSFPSFASTDIKVEVDGTLKTVSTHYNITSYTTSGGGNVVFTGGNIPTSPSTIRIYRDTDVDTAQATYAAGSSVKAGDLNNNQTQLLYGIQEEKNQTLTTTDFKDLSVTTAKIAADAIDGTKLADNAVDSEHYTDGSIDRIHLEADIIDSTKLADNAVNSEHYVDGSIDRVHLEADIIDGTKLADDAVAAEHIASNAVVSDSIVDGSVVNVDINAAAAIAHTKLAAIPDGQILVGSGSTVPTAVAVSGDITIANTGAVTIANDAVEIGMIGCEQTTITDSDSHLPTSGAVVDYVAAQLEPFGGFEVIANRTSFPNTQPVSGVVISILDANGIVFDSTSTPDTTTGNCTEVDGTNVTIQAAPDALQGKTIGAGVGMLVSSTGSGTNYTFHRLLAKDGDVEQLSQDIEDFKARYRVNAGEPGSNNDDGDLVWDTNANKMKVYDSTAGAWTEVTSTGEFKYLFLCPAGGTGAPTLDGSIATYDLRESSNSGTAATVTNAAQLIVSINGVVQKANTGTSAPAEGFALVDANTIIFGANLASGDSVFIIQIGSAVSIPTPGDDTVTSAKIVDGAILNVDINASAAIAGSKLADDSIAEVKLDIHNAPSGTDKFLKYTSNGMEWVVPSYTTNTTVGGATGADFNDDIKVRFGTGNDFEIYHSATGDHSYIHNKGAGNLQVKSDESLYLRINDTEESINCNKNGSVEIFHDNVKEFETKSGGVKLLGHSESIVTALTSASSVTIDFSLSNHFSCTMGHNIAFGNPTTESVGQSGTIVLTQDGTGSRTASWGSQFLWPGGTAPTLSTAAAAVDRIDYFVAAADKIHCVASLGMA